MRTRSFIKTSRANITRISETTFLSLIFRDHKRTSFSNFTYKSKDIYLERCAVLLLIEVDTRKPVIFSKQLTGMHF